MVSEKMTIETKLDEIKAAKLLVHNLFQLEDNIWQANLTDGEKAWEFGRGESPEAALTAALHKAEHGTAVPLRKQSSPKDDIVVAEQILKDLFGEIPT